MLLKTTLHVDESQYKQLAISNYPFGYHFEEFTRRLHSLSQAYDLSAYDIIGYVRSRLANQTLTTSPVAFSHAPLSFRLESEDASVLDFYNSQGMPAGRVLRMAYSLLSYLSNVYGPDMIYINYMLKTLEPDYDLTVSQEFTRDSKEQDVQVSDITVTPPVTRKPPVQKAEMTHEEITSETSQLPKLKIKKSSSPKTSKPKVRPRSQPKSSVLDELKEAQSVIERLDDGVKDLSERLDSNKEPLEIPTGLPDQDTVKPNALLGDFI